MFAMRTKRLEIVAATLEHLCAELDSPTQLEKLLCAAIPEGWPPGEYDRPAIEFFRDRLAESPSMAGWLTWYAIERASDGRAARLVAAGGYCGPPDADGSVEIGYSVVQDCRSRGIATELVAALVGHALSFSEVRRVVAQTRVDNVGSIIVLDRCGFVLIGPGRDAGLLRYACERAVVM
jgi:[ribosomal protein S5]-alanine N-acetyltransferase